VLLKIADALFASLLDESWVRTELPEKIYDRAVVVSIMLAVVPTCRGASGLGSSMPTFAGAANHVNICADAAASVGVHL
jgi:hypothetical protein